MVRRRGDMPQGDSALQPEGAAAGRWDVERGAARRSLDAECDKSKVCFIDGLAIEGLQAEVVQPGRVRVMWTRRASGSDRDLECAIEVVRVPLACDGTVHP